MSIAQGTKAKAGVEINGFDSLGTPTTVNEVALVSETVALIRTPIPNEILTGVTGRTAPDEGSDVVRGGQLNSTRLDSLPREEFD